jgi:outer membrane protein assembly factor BamB
VDLATGKPLWTTPVAPMVEFQNKYGEGPRSTPLIEDDRVYVQSCSGEFRCLNLADGKTRWRVNFEKDYGATFLGNKSNDPEAKETASRRHGNNGSAAIDGNRIFVPVGSPKGATLVCFDKMTGKELWRAGNDNTAYSSVVVATLAGTRQVVHFTADALMGVAVENGKILWREPLKTGAKRHVCTPVISGDSVTVSSSSIGTIKFKISRKGAEYAAERAWENKRLKTVIGTPVVYGKLLFTLGPGDRTDLVCVDFETGKELWAQSGSNDYASLEIINDKLVALESSGELLLVKASGEGYQELGRLQVSGKTWASPAYSDGKLIVKDDKNVTAFSLAN